MSLLYSSTMANPDQEKVDSAAESARVLVEAVKRDLKPRDIITKESIENAVSVIMATGGSTNAVLHYLAIAHAAEVDWTIEDFERIRKRVPVICDLKPSGKYVATDLHRAGGIPQVLKILLDAGLLHGDCMTITGRTLADELKDVPSVPRAPDVIFPIDRALYKEGHLAILKGNLAEDGAVAKITGLKNPVITGGTRVRRRAERDGCDTRRPDSRRRHPRAALPRPEGRPRHAGNARADVGDHRQEPANQSASSRTAASRAAPGMVVGHVAPEAFVGGTIALVQEGDSITIDAHRLLLQLNVDDAELARRRAAWQQPAPRYTRGVLAKFAALARPANQAPSRVDPGTSRHATPINMAAGERAKRAFPLLL